MSPRTERARLDRLPFTAIAALFAAAFAASLLSCSERPLPQVFVWDAVSQAVLIENSALTAVAAISRDEAIAVGYATPKGAGFSHSTSFHRAGPRWTEVIVPAPAHTGSNSLLAAVRAPDGSVWACGSVRQLQDEPSTAQPIVYRYAGGLWTEVSLAEVGDLLGSELDAIAVSGIGPGLEVRAVGTTLGEGLALRFAGGHWSRMPLATSSPFAKSWGLAAVGRAPSGLWYAAGSRLDAPGGAIFADSGRGWRQLIGPAGPALYSTALAFDAEGDLWLAGNTFDGDSLQGVLYHHRAGAFVAVSITRRSGGSYRLLGLGFDAVGHGWAVGGRTPDDPFFAGLQGDHWVETVAEREHELGPPPPGEQGGEIFTVSVVALDVAFAAGQTEEIGHEGEPEVAPRLFELRARPVGERDALRPAPDDR